MAPAEERQVGGLAVGRRERRVELADVRLRVTARGGNEAAILLFAVGDILDAPSADDTSRRRPAR
ncbi:hypothetical protein [Actinacidiphila glaucinigra]|uniref:hypothetical protein n=1 Tax=Actinacidiphila glaucinigra TaxID=235986 RepID=UPI0036E227AC